MYVDLLRVTAVEVSSFETTQGPLREEGLCLWLGVMAVFGNAEDSGYYMYMYNTALLEHATGTGPLPPSPLLFQGSSQ